MKFHSIVYGELDLVDRSKAYVRDLSNYWDYSELSIALNIFKTKLDGFKLSELISSSWSSGSKAIKRFSEIVQTNFSLQILDVIPQIRNALAKYPANAPSWLESIKPILEEICKLKNEKFMARTLYNYSQFLYEHQLNVQAVITLQVAVETCIAEKYGEENYEWWQETGRKELNKLKFPNNHEYGSNNKKQIGLPLNNLENFRNQIAHGGGKNKAGNCPQAANIPGIYESGIRGIKNLFELLGI